MKVGYCRVSTQEQNIQRQIDLFEELGVEKVFIDKASGANTTNRPELKALLNFVREKDIVYCADISRLARSVKDLLSICEELKNKNVDIVFVKEGFNTTTAMGKAMLSIFGAMYELELSNIRERQRMGIEATKKHHPERYAGRKKIDIDKEKFISMAKEVDKGALTVRALCKELNISPQTYYRRRSEYRLSEN